MDNIYIDDEGCKRARFNNLRVFETEFDMHEEMGDGMVVAQGEQTPAGDNLIWCYSENDSRQCYILNE